MACLHWGIVIKGAVSVPIIIISFQTYHEHIWDLLCCIAILFVLGFGLGFWPPPKKSHSKLYVVLYVRLKLMKKW